MKRKLTIVSISALVLGMPLLAGAATGSPDLVYIQGYSNLIISVINDYLVPILVSIAFIVFLWGVYKYFIQPDGEREEGRQFIMYGIIGFAILFSVWGLVRMVQSTIILDSSSAAPTPPILNFK